MQLWLEKEYLESLNKICQPDIGSDVFYATQSVKFYVIGQSTPISTLHWRRKPYVTKLSHGNAFLDV